MFKPFLLTVVAAIAGFAQEPPTPVPAAPPVQTPATAPAPAQTPPAAPTAPSTVPAHPNANDATADMPVMTPRTAEQTISCFVTATEKEESDQRGVTMTVHIDASVPKLNKAGKLDALRNISKLGKISYHMLGFTGDNTVKKEVIGRYLSAEVEAQKGPNIAISPDNYKFKYRGIHDVDGRLVYEFNLAPRKKKVGFFKGDVWMDAQSCMPVREEGTFVKTPSVFLKKMQFVRTFEVQNGVAFMQQLESHVETRLFGAVELSINYGKPKPENEVPEVVATVAP